ncbi:MAG: hydrogen peroxide-inducible genes activator [Burkholderiales bacterium]|jgi:LysR family hydrogen peroxide-inducible transcriptional activator|nr:hydrogen peroxide-inducible genes activator [Burkholderiales bacterium]
MTLTELRYIVAVAHARHFGRAAEACFVSQPTLSVAVKKLEEELGVQLFERGPTEVTVTAAGGRVVEQAQRALEEADKIRNIAKSTGDPLEGPLKLGVIFTIAPYLLPQLIPVLRRRAPKMPLMLEENYTATLSERLKRGDIDAAIVALPFSEAGITVTPLYDESFVVALAKTHSWAARKSIAADELARESLLLLGTGHCFRDQVLDACPALNRSSAMPGSLQKTVEGSSLETIRLMVASGMGMTVLPASAVPAKRAAADLLTYVPFSRPVPDRRVVLASRSSFARNAALDVIRDAVAACDLNGSTPVKKK